MRLFAISDLHLSLGVDKPMDIFGEQWVNHADRMREAWDEMVGPDDWILVGGDTSDRVDETFSEYYGGDRDERPSRMIRSGPWKLYMYDGDDAPVLFNLDDDPGEMVDLGGEPSHADVRDDLLARLHVGWEPDVVASESDAMHQDWETLVGWGAAVRPGHEDMIDVPDVEDVTIL